VQFVTIWQRPSENACANCIIWGKNKVTPPDVAEEFKQLLQLHLIWIDKCGHAAMMEQPEEFNRLLEEWLTKSIYNTSS
jgi:pimeloyl-ACP methyl ester carboxylesterase